MSEISIEKGHLALFHSLVEDATLSFFIGSRKPRKVPAEGQVVLEQERSIAGLRHALHAS
jgi:hypothetical protein